MDTIRQLYNEWQSLQPLNTDDQKRLDQKFMLEFNYNSNHIEGNTLTYGQTKLLFMFGETTGNANLRDYEEMKAHNVGLEMIKREATDKERPLSEVFIRELNRTILVENFWKNAVTPTGDATRIEVKVGVYKTRQNSVITATGEIFEYASPQETPAFMTDLVNWYNEEERKEELSPIELAALLHYRYIRIHPFEDGNGRIARLLVNYVLHRHGYPMIVIRSDKEHKDEYLRILHQCDVEVGLSSSDGAYASIEHIQQFVSYMEALLKQSLEISIKAAKGEIIEEQGDWSKKLQIKLRETKVKPVITLEERQKVVANSFYNAIKAIDTAFIPYEKYFVIIEKRIPGALKTLEEMKTHSIKGIAGLSYTAKYQIYYNKSSFSYEVSCKLNEESYSISVTADGDKLEIPSIEYSHFLSDEEISPFVEFAGKKLSKFVELNMLDINGTN